MQPRRRESSPRPLPSGTRTSRDGGPGRTTAAHFPSVDSSDANPSPSFLGGAVRAEEVEGTALVVEQAIFPSAEIPITFALPKTVRFRSLVSRRDRPRLHSGRGQPRAASGHPARHPCTVMRAEAFATRGALCPQGPWLVQNYRSLEQDLLARGAPGKAADATHALLARCSQLPAGEVRHVDAVVFDECHPLHPKERIAEESAIPP